MVTSQVKLRNVMWIQEPSQFIHGLIMNRDSPVFVTVGDVSAVCLSELATPLCFCNAAPVFSFLIILWSYCRTSE